MLFLLKRSSAYVVLWCAAALLPVVFSQDASSQSAARGTVYDNLSMHSDILDGERKYAVYLPPDYDVSERSYPVLYLLHGAGDDQTGWIQFGEVRHIADKAFAKGMATPMVIVMPDANTGRRVEGAQFDWSSSAVSVATVNAGGLVRGVAEGVVTITATAGSASATAEIAVENPDRVALVALYNATDGPNWVNNDNWLTDAPLREWYGVTGFDTARRIQSLDLPGNNLSGPIPPEIENLAGLNRLTLKNNALSGPIPPEIENLAGLNQLTLNNNALSGPIPLEIGNLIGLVNLSLAHNNLDGGPIPLEFANLVSLERLQLDIRHCAPPELRPWLHERRIDILPCTDPGGRLLPTALLREDSDGLSLALDDDLHDPLSVTISDRAVVTASVQDGWLVLSPRGIGEADVEIVPSGGGATATAAVVVRAAVGTFGIDIVMEQPVTELYAETITGAADWWSSALNGTEWEGRDAREYCNHWESNVPVAAKGNDLVIWAQRETDPSYTPGASAWTCRRREGLETEPSHYYPVAGIVTTNARVPHFFGSAFIMRHELGHVLGLTGAFPPATGLVTEDYKYFIGSRAVAVYREGGGDPDLPGIPMSGPHWAGDVWPELMIGSDRSGYFADELSVAALADAGYTVDMSKTTAWSASGMDETASAPENPQAAAGDAQVTLSWDPPGDNGGADITGYAYRYKESGGDFTAYMDIPGSGPGEANARSYTVTGLANGLEYVFQVRAMNEHGGGVPAEVIVMLPAVTNTENEELPTRVTLSGNYPNPFNPETTIRYALPQAGQVHLAVYNLLGREVAILVEGSKPAGHHTVRFGADNLASGVYVYRLQAQGKTIVRTMILVK